MKNIISIIADAITILGIGGIVSWSAFRKKKGAFENTVLDILAFSVKLCLCVLVLLIPAALILPLSIPFTGIFLRDLADMPIEFGRNHYWHSGTPTPYVIVYCFHAVLLLPWLVVLCVCIMKWSFSPFGHLFARLRGTSKNVADSDE